MKDKKIQAELRQRLIGDLNREIDSEREVDKEGRDLGRKLIGAVESQVKVREQHRRDVVRQKKNSWLQDQELASRYAPPQTAEYKEKLAQIRRESRRRNDLTRAKKEPYVPGQLPIIAGSENKKLVRRQNETQDVVKRGWSPDDEIL